MDLRCERVHINLVDAASTSLSLQRDDGLAAQSRPSRTNERSSNDELSGFVSFTGFDRFQVIAWCL